MSPHQWDMVRALRNVPADTEFTVGDMVKLYGYPHKDASKVLQQDAILLEWIGYSDPCYRAGKIRYKLRADFDVLYAALPQ